MMNQDRGNSTLFPTCRAFLKRSPVNPIVLTSLLPKTGVVIAISTSRVKDPIPKGQQTNVIYHITRATCSCTYVDHTDRRLGTGIREHQLATRRRDLLSLVFEHAPEFYHRFNWDGNEVLAMANTK
ncbi:unnamed protein product [Dibothriocephalus latus]|uniref:Uncharacterized protein n=1 Tax=Dibothriocephalus latus TaxID=60516 RepID=A0A3P7PSJ8_DIBLA|nr:unnamed protein product [Dibothriocephalus latus]